MKTVSVRPVVSQRCLCVLQGSIKLPEEGGVKMVQLTRKKESCYLEC